MTADQQLERSVLESKERDELHAIAQALSVKTNTRTKKADIIDGILKAAGVAVSDADSSAPPSGARSNGGGAAADSRPDARRQGIRTHGRRIAKGNCSSAPGRGGTQTA